MPLIIHTDGGSRGNPGPAAAGVVIARDDGRIVFEAGFHLGRMTNNQAEYTALVRALEALQSFPDEELTLVSDSELMVRQIKGEYRVKNAALRPLYEQACRLLAGFSDWSIRHVRRESNTRADELANLAMDMGDDLIEIDLRSELGPVQLAGDTPNGESPGVSADGRSDVPARASSDKLTGPPVKTAVARCRVAPDKTACPAPCGLGTDYCFARVLPAGTCLEVAGSMLEAARRAIDSGRASKVTCPRAGCGAEFDVRSE